MGTRFIATEEANADQAYKRAFANRHDAGVEGGRSA
jgi:NAD(P)H-dependent flavin oxidoreductase YrpB (nitropropane dioxygenase family)